ncbi:MAG: homoserine dehydrogenase [Bacteroidales bacterium]|jgi:homoserine dehydrogenase|nr:homoserine dehydrogenase [Bacteroidales bacterium]MDD2812334.1 homoserine dehydrogenase [Bacteroidales bacterium]MDD3385422.1 homoserine dehydrogenase [Bacteroidales bacterium]MDD3871961.1 homoserine dehydrogenase [Bacteroidales bacterium]
MTNEKNNSLVIGLFGFGVVGQGLYQVLQDVQTANATIKSICVKQKEKPRSLPEHLFTFEPDDLLNDKDINLIVELIDDADAAYQIVKRALLNGKSVVSGNKKMLAHHLDELIEIQKDNSVALLYDASACGSIPVIRNLEEYYDNDLLQSITGILNGSSNFILSRIFQDNWSYADALKHAQELGFAESNPTFDVDGYDSMYKLVILALHGFGTLVDPADVFHYGISTISGHDIRYATEKGRKIKLVAQVTKINGRRFSLFVLPKLITPEEYIYNVEDEYNGVIIEGQFYDKQFMFGKGAGAFPTGSAVLSDITAQKHHYRYEYKKLNFFDPPVVTRNINLEVYLRYHNLLDLSHFDFESISEKYAGPDYHYVIGKIKLETLYNLKNLIRKLNVFIAWTGKLDIND